MQVRQIGQRKSKAADDPGAGKQRGDKVGRAGRATLQGMQNLADRLLIVIGGVSGGIDNIRGARGGVGLSLDD